MENKIYFLIRKKTAEFAFSSIVSTKKILRVKSLVLKTFGKETRRLYKAYNFNLLLGKKQKGYFNKSIIKKDV